VHIGKIGIIHLNQIGDLVFSLPLLKALRESYPEATIHSIVKPYLQELLDGSPYVDAVLLRADGLGPKINLLRQMRKNRYDLVISLSESEECLLLAALSGAGRKAGFAHFPWDLSLNIKEHVEGHHGWYNNRKLLARLQVPVSQANYVGLLHLGDDGFWDQLPDRFVVIAAGTSPRRLVKAWPEENYGELIRRLKGAYNLDLVLVGGDEDRLINDKILDCALRKSKEERPEIVDLTGACGLRDLCSVLRRAALFVGIDSGIMHLAAAMDIPLVGIFGPTDPFYVGPQNDNSVIVRREELECVPCYLRGCEDRACLTGLDVARVMAACARVLSSTRD
jgi:ADP-heptose:LPS heptosyltransferase